MSDIETLTRKAVVTVSVEWDPSGPHSAEETIRAALELDPDCYEVEGVLDDGA